MGAKGKPRGPHKLAFLPFSKGSLGQDPQAQLSSAVPQLEHQPFLPPCPPRAGSASSITSHCSQGCSSQIQVPASLQELPPAALQRHWVWTHGDKDTQHTTGRCRLCSRGSQRSIALEFGGRDPINAVGQRLGEALWHPANSHCNSSTRLDSLNASAGVGNFHVFPRFL